MSQNQELKQFEDSCSEQILNTFRKMKDSSMSMSFATTYFNTLRGAKATSKNRYHQIRQNNLKNNRTSKGRCSTQTDEMKETQQQINLKSHRLKFQSSHPSGKKMYDLTQSLKPYRTIKQEKLAVNPAITKQNFFVKIFAPMTQTNKFIQVSKKEEKAVMRSKKSVDSKISSKQIRSRHDSQLSKKSKGQTPRTEKIKLQLKRIEQCIKDEDIVNRLINFLQAHNSPLPTEKAKYNVRVYKEDYKKIYQDRYGKDRVTNYINLEYITEFSEIKETLTDFLNYTREELMLLAFIIIDQDRDGLITADDLIFLNGTTRNKVSTNLLLQEDITKIIEYVRQQKEAGDFVFDYVTHSQLVKEQQLTIIKYRIFNFELAKKQRGSKERTKSLITRKIHDHLFTLKQRTPNESAQKNKNQPFNLKNLLKFSKIVIDRDKSHNFAINFTRFCTIFTELPKVIYDVLYVLAGIKIPELFYSPIDWKIFAAEVSHKKTTSTEKNLYEETMRKLEKLKELKKKLKTVKW